MRRTTVADVMASDVITASPDASFAELARLLHGAGLRAVCRSSTRRGCRTVKVFGWYDNEWGYAQRTVDLVEMVARLLPAR